MTPLRKNILSYSAGWIVCTVVIIMANLHTVGPAYIQMFLHPQAVGKDPSAAFLSFKPYLKNVPEVGYLTDKDMSPERNDGTFLQAQYALAPVILDLNNTDHDFLIIDPAHFLSAMDLTQHLSVEFLQVSPDNKILAKKK